jgi:hypothetical protein
VTDEKIIEVRRKGRTMTVYRMPDGTYSCYVDGVNTQYDLTAEEVMGWLGNALEDGS